MDLELVSFALCPYVQRSVIALERKKAAYRVTEIDLDDPPAWFEEISPLGQVPVLRIDGRHVIFESAVICELVDELFPPRLLPEDPIERAKERAWIEFGGSLIRDAFGLMTEDEPAKVDAREAELFDDLARLEPIVAGPYFRGADFGLVDASYAPLFARLDVVPRLARSPRWEAMPKVRAWSRALLEVPEVRASLPADFATAFPARMKEYGGALFAGA